MLGYCISVAAEHAYAGTPPLWVYAEMAKPLVVLMGEEGYHIMVGVHYIELLPLGHVLIMRSTTAVKKCLNGQG